MYLAEDVSLHRRVAVKLLHAGLGADRRFARRFESEARSSAQLNHPHVLAVYDWSDTDPAYLVCELLEGGSLRSMLDAAGAISPSQALLVGLHTAQGLAYAHGRGFVHRDIKPANLLFDRDARLRIADFGIARAVAEAAWTEPEGALMGTARYAAPEQASGGMIDGRTDVYGLALSLVEAVTGEVPMTAPSALATMLLRQDVDLVVPESLGPLGPALEAAGRADPSRRSDAATLTRDLHAAATSMPRPRPLPLAPIDVDGLIDEARRRDPWPETGSSGDVAGAASLDSSRLDVDRDRIDLGSADAAGAVPARRRSDHTTDALPSTETSVVEERTERLDLVGDVRGPDHEPGGAPTDGPEGGDPALTEAVFADPPLDDRALDERGDEGDEDLVDVPDRRRRWPILVLLVLLLAGAAVALLNRDLAPEGLTEVFAPVTHPMGTFVGLPIEQVQQDIDLNNWVAEISYTRQDGSEVGEVLSQAPEPGTEWEEGLSVQVVVSQGPELRIVPELVSLELAAARGALAEVKLEIGEITTTFSEDIPVDVVLSASVAAGTELESGQTIDLEISGGPEPRLVPALAGSTYETAEATLAGLGLVAERIEDFSVDVAEGQVIAITPDPGASVPRGFVVSVLVSKGRPFVTVPDVTGKPAAEAADILEAAGFVVTDVEGKPNAEVLATNPPAGEGHRLGTSIVLFTR